LPLIIPLADIDLSTRVDLGLRMLDPARPWGEASPLAREYGVSRKFLYQLRAQSEQALCEALTPQPAGRQPQRAVLTVNRAFLCRAMLVLATAMPGTIRAIQLVLELLAQGIRFQDVSSDDALGIQAGAREVQLVVPWRPDLFHLLQDGQRITCHLEKV
jgi:hypothetical protein